MGCRSGEGMKCIDVLLLKEEGRIRNGDVG